jgi:cytoskeletal protein CcmA (bactofilin family)
MSKEYYSAQEGLGYLGEDLLIQGTIHTEKKIIVSCTVEGSLHGDQEIIISKTANINGKIEGNVVVVAGKINGDMLVHERLEVNSTANLRGEVHVPSGQLLIQEGAYMEGQCITSKDKHAKQLAS